MDSLKEIKLKFLKQDKLSVTELAVKTGLTAHRLYYLLGDTAKTIPLEEYILIIKVLDEDSSTPYNCDSITGNTLQLISNITEQITKLSIQVQKATADGKVTEQEILLMKVSVDRLEEKALEAISRFRKLLKGAKR